MLTEEAIQRVQSLYSRGVQSDDSRLSSRHIYSKLNSVRNMLTIQKLNKKQKINSWSYQTIPCIELITVSIHDCPCLPPKGCTIYRSKHKIPKPLNSIFGELIQSVSSLTGEIIYSPVLFKELKYQEGNKYTGNKSKYFIRNEYLYIVQKNGNKVITMTGIFEDPIKVAKFPSYCGEGNTESSCVSPLKLVFPIDEELIEPMITLAVEELIGVFITRPQDKQNNTNDDTGNIQ